MADPIIVAQRRADATRKFREEAAKLADRTGVAGPRAIPPEINRDPELWKVYEIEVMADFLADLNAALDRPAAARAVKNAVAEESRAQQAEPAKAAEHPATAPKPVPKATAPAPASQPKSPQASAPPPQQPKK